MRKFRKIENTNIQIYQTKDGSTEVIVKIYNETVWLSQKQMAQLFDKDSDTISLHLKKIYNSGELVEKSTTQESSVVQKERQRNVRRKVKAYKLDAIISVGYRVNSKQGVPFRIWANSILKEYLLKGYALDKKCLAQQNEQLKEFSKSNNLLFY